MKAEYLYVILSADGECWRIVGREYEDASLPDLLAEGWRPVRETPFSGVEQILICLEREPEERVGFGFGH